MMHVIGYCPNGCGRTLGIGSSHQITCVADTCPRPSAAHELLADAETEHLVELLAETFNVRHPLRERIGEQILTCPLGQWIDKHDAPPEEPGRYRVTIEDIAEDGALTVQWQRVGDVA